MEKRKGEAETQRDQTDVRIDEIGGERLELKKRSYYKRVEPLLAQAVRTSHRPKALSFPTADSITVFPASEHKHR